MTAHLVLFSSYIKLYIIYIYRAWRDDGLSHCTCCCRVYLVQVSVSTHTTMPPCLPVSLPACPLPCHSFIMHGLSVAMQGHKQLYTSVYSKYSHFLFILIVTVTNTYYVLCSIGLFCLCTFILLHVIFTFYSIIIC